MNGIAADTQLVTRDVPRGKRSWIRLLRILCAAYILGLVLTIALLRLVGERWWPTTVLLYVPRIVFALPAVPLLILSLNARSRTLILSQVAATIVAATLAGFELSWPHHHDAAAFSFRLATCNMATGSMAVEDIVTELRRSNADVIVLQEAHENLHDRLNAAAAGMFVSANGQFWIASRFPIVEVVEPGKLPFDGKARAPRFARYRLSTPRGQLLLYNVHFISPRDGLEELRGEGFAYELRRGRLLPGRSRAVIDRNTALREAQMQAVRDDIAREPHPAIIAGDTNLPGMSWALSHWFGKYRDGFSEAGQGFGYTFPAPKHAWMRIDRILADRALRFTDFEVIRKPLSDHFPAIARLEWPSAN